jgi:hypothetical protein
MSLLAAYLATLTSAPSVALEPFYSVQDYIFNSSSGSASAGFGLINDGSIRAFTSRFGDQNIGSWIIPNSVAPGSYQARISGLSGDALDAGPHSPNVWINLSLAPIWYLTQNATGDKSCRFTIEVRLGTTVLTSSSILLEAVVDQLRFGGDDLQPPNEF